MIPKLRRIYMTNLTTLKRLLVYQTTAPEHHSLRDGNGSCGVYNCNYKIRVCNNILIDQWTIKVNIMSTWIFPVIYICIIKFTSTTRCCIAFSGGNDSSMWFLNKRKTETAFQGTKPYTSRNAYCNTWGFIKSLQRATSDHFGRRMNSTTSSYSLCFFSYKRSFTLTKSVLLI